MRELGNVDGLDTGAIKSQIELEMRLHAAEEALNKSERFLSDKTDENRRLKEENNQLTSKSSLHFRSHSYISIYSFQSMLKSKLFVRSGM